MEHYFEEERIILILKYIQNKNYITLTEIAKKINVSTRTIRNDIKLLNNIFNDIAFIDNDNEQGGYCLYILDIEKFERKKEELFKINNYLDSPKKRMAYIFKKLLVSDISCIIDDLAYEMNVGRSTVNADIKKLNEILSSYGIFIEGKSNNGIKLFGSELNIRFFIMENLYDLVYSKDYINNYINEALDFIYKKYCFENMTRVAFEKSVIIMMNRIFDNKYIEKLPDKYYDIEKNNMFRTAEEISEMLSEAFNIKIPIEEKIFISIPLTCMRTPTDIKTINEIDITDDIEILINEIINQIKYELNIYLDKKNLNEEFVYHISFMINRLKFGYLLKNPISNEIKEKYPLAYKMACIAGKIIEKEYNLFVPEDELCYITAYFGAYMLEYKTQNNYYKVALVCSTGRGTARLISTHLKRILDKDAVIDIFADNQVNDMILNSYDIVFTTININFDIKSPIIKLKDIFDENEIRLKIEKTKQLQKLSMSNTKTSGISVIAALLDNDRFFILDNNKSYIENTFDMIDSLYNKGLVDEYFKERIRIREKKSTMIFDKQIAFPHSINILNNRNVALKDKLIVSIGVCEEGIENNNNKIKIVFLLALPEDDEQDDTILVRIYDEIISIAKQENIVSEISKAKDFKSVVKNFIKFGIGNNI